MRNGLRNVLATSLLLVALAGTAQERGNWRASSSNAHAITGDLILTDEKIYVDAFTPFTMVRVRDLTAAEAAAAFGPDNSTGGLYRTEIPGDKKFLHKNTLCGGDDTHWMAASISGRTLKVAFFSSQAPPVFTLEALSSSTDLCGTFTYVK